MAFIKRGKSVYKYAVMTTPAVEGFKYEGGSKTLRGAVKLGERIAKKHPKKIVHIFHCVGFID